MFFEGGVEMWYVGFGFEYIVGGKLCGEKRS